MGRGREAKEIFGLAYVAILEGAFPFSINRQDLRRGSFLVGLVTPSSPSVKWLGQRCGQVGDARAFTGRLWFYSR